MSNGSSLKIINYKTGYNSNDDNLAEDFFIPVLNRSNYFFRGVGYFSSLGFRKILRGLSTFLQQDDYTLRFVVGDVTNQQDIVDIKRGLTLKDLMKDKEWIESHLIDRFEKIVDELDEVTRVPADLMTNLIALDKIEIKYATFNNELFHAKYGLMKDNEGNGIAISGSLNHSQNGMENQYEKFNVFRSWEEKDLYNNEEEEIRRLWEGEMNDITIVDISKEILDKIFKKRMNDGGFIPPQKLTQKYEEEQNKLFEEDNINVELIPKRPEKINGKNFIIRDHQSEAALNWEKNNFKGIFKHATGSGKTVASINAATQIFQYKEDKRLALIVSVPFRDLVDQWEGQLKNFNWSPIKCYRKESDWKSKLDKSISDFQLNITSSLSIVVTNDTMCENQTFNDFINRIDKEKIMFIGDECHHHSTDGRRKGIPQSKYTLGLSATPLHYYNKEKQDITLGIYDKVVDEYSLEKGIEDGVLSPFEYNFVAVTLTEEESDNYLTATIKAMSYYDSKSKKFNERATPFLNERARIIQSCSNKIPALESLINKNGITKHTLFYVGDGRINDEENDSESIKQLTAVSKVLSDNNWKTHKFTYREDHYDRRVILNNFKDKEIDGIVAIKCLDEGIDIPDCQLAYLIASNKNERQYIQRTGRILRPSDNKDFAVVWDFLVLPEKTKELEDYNKNLILSEMKRVKHFRDHCNNKNNVTTKVNKILNDYSLPDIDDVDFENIYD